MAKEELFDWESETKFILSFTEVDELQKLYNERRLKNGARAATQHGAQAAASATLPTAE
jgi:hypothetical protein